MSRLLISTAIAGILAFGGAAYAQGDDHRGGGGGEHASGHDAARAPEAARPAQAARPAAPQGGGHDRGHMDQQRPAAAAAPAAQHSGHNVPGPGNAMRGPAPNNANNAMRGPANNNAMRGAAAGNSHRNFTSYQRNFSAPKHFHAPSAYRRPSGWYAHRWTYGEILPSLFWASDYWLNDYNDYGLMSPPPGTVWVRDGNDALLIDQYSGEIIQVEYSVFY